MSALVEPYELHRLTIAEYHDLIKSGGLSEDMRVELIDGLLVDTGPRSPQHENAIDWLVDWLVGHLDLQRFRMRVTGPLTLGSSEPEPDVAVVDRAPPQRAHPSAARLVIEVAVSSRDRDLRTKPAVYAPYVTEYWVVDLDRRCLVVHRNAVDGAYRDVNVVEHGTSVAPLALDLPPLDTDALFTAAFAE
ncbi:MAG: Uma2 family endonuclease [Acidobacteriota bacterium]|nr:Uma2 family endonuclease [Acidobacteriota bacterium]